MLARCGSDHGPVLSAAPRCRHRVSLFGDARETVLLSIFQQLRRRPHMLSIGTTAVPSVCLRCQLRTIVSRTGKRVSATRLEYARGNPSQSFSAASVRCQDHEEQTVDDNTGSNRNSRLSEYPLGRIYGKPGRRHRETSARLTKDSMQKPFEVIVLRDVPEPREERKAISVASSDALKTRVSDVSQIARDLLLKDNDPNQDEVRESIDALRPDTTIVDGVLYKSLVKMLVDGYNLRQLSRYLIHALQQVSVGAADEELSQKELRQDEGSLQTPPWKPGKTPLHQRHNMVGVLKNGAIGSSKSKLADQILRLSWSLSIEGEMQRVGELEMKFEAWQLRYLFDITSKGKPTYETLIDSPLLVGSADLRPDRTDNILRIVARKLDAEAIAERIKDKFRDFVSLDVDLSAFTTPRGRRQRSTSTKGLVGNTSLQTIEKRLCCIFERKDDKTVAVHADSDVTLHHARRALLSLLDLPSPSYVETATIITRPNAAEHQVDSGSIRFLQEQPGLDIKSRSFTTHIGRLTEPTILQTSVNQERSTTEEVEIRDVLSRSTHAQQLTHRLLAIKPLDTVPFNESVNENSFWRPEEPLGHQPWEVEFCKLLHQDLRTTDIARIVSGDAQLSEDTKTPHKPPMPSIIQSQIPGISSLLHYFSPMSGSIESPILVAHFVPSPFTTSGLAPLMSLPRIRIAYRIWQYPEGTRQRKAKLKSVHAIFLEQDLRVHLPQETTDLRIARRSTIRANGYAAPQNPSIRSFTHTLQRSIDRMLSTLRGDPTITVRIPSQPFVHMTDAWVKDLRDHDFEVEYLFEKFEQVQSVDFIPVTTGISGAMDPIMRKVLEDMPNDMLLRYQEIEGGIVGGRRVELKLQYSSAVWEGKTRILDFDANAGDSANVRVLSQEETEKKYLKLMETSLGLANALTRINARELRPVQHNSEESERTSHAAPEW